MNDVLTRATTLEDASDLFAFVQDVGVTYEAIHDLYVEPPGPQPDTELPPISSVREEITRQLVRRRARAEKVFVTGQKGAGKSATLARIARDPAVLAHFATLPVRATRHIPAGAADIRLVLIMLVTELVRFIDAEKLGERVDVGMSVGGITRVLAPWVKLFATQTTPEAPETFQSAKVKLSAQFLELSEEIVRDPQRRKQILDDSRYSVTELGRVVTALVEFIQQALAVRVDGPQFLLLIVDDLDKYVVPREVESIFSDGLEALRSIPCTIILTYPYFLNFGGNFSVLEKAVAIQNVKVAERSGDQVAGMTFPSLDERVLLDPARRFFNELFEKLADRELLAGQAVIDRAALLSAGIPREFLRLLSAAFELCIDFRKPRLDLQVLEVARIRLRQVMARVVNEPWKQAGLKLVRHRGEIQGFSEMLDTVHVVEYVNSASWYGVHPVMEDLVDDWIRQDRNLLLEKGTDAPTALRELEARWRQEAATHLKGAD